MSDQDEEFRLEDLESIDSSSIHTCEELETPSRPQSAFPLDELESILQGTDLQLPSSNLSRNVSLPMIERLKYLKGHLKHLQRMYEQHEHIEEIEARDTLIQALVTSSITLFRHCNTFNSFLIAVKALLCQYLPTKNAKLIPIEQDIEQSGHFFMVLPTGKQVPVGLGISATSFPSSGHHASGIAGKMITFCSQMTQVDRKRSRRRRESSSRNYDSRQSSAASTASRGSTKLDTRMNMGWYATKEFTSTTHTKQEEEQEREEAEEGRHEWLEERFETSAVQWFKRHALQVSQHKDGNVMAFFPDMYQEFYEFDQDIDIQPPRLTKDQVLEDTGLLVMPLKNPSTGEYVGILEAIVDRSKLNQSFLEGFSVVVTSALEARRRLCRSSLGSLVVDIEHVENERPVSPKSHVFPLTSSTQMVVKGNQLKEDDDVLLTAVQRVLTRLVKQNDSTLKDYQKARQVFERLEKCWQQAEEFCNSIRLQKNITPKSLVKYTLGQIFRKQICQLFLHEEEDTTSTTTGRRDLKITSIFLFANETKESFLARHLDDNGYGDGDAEEEEQMLDVEVQYDILRQVIHTSEPFQSIFDHPQQQQQQQQDTGNTTNTTTTSNSSSNSSSNSNFVLCLPVVATVATGEEREEQDRSPLGSLLCFGEFNCKMDFDWIKEILHGFTSLFNIFLQKIHFQLDLNEKNHLLTTKVSSLQHQTKELTRLNQLSTLLHSIKDKCTKTLLLKNDQDENMEAQIVHIVHSTLSEQWKSIIQTQDREEDTVVDLMDRITFFLYDKEEGSKLITYVNSMDELKKIELTIGTMNTFQKAAAGLAGLVVKTQEPIVGSRTHPSFDDSFQNQLTDLLNDCQRKKKKKIKESEWFYLVPVFHTTKGLIGVLEFACTCMAQVDTLKTQLDLFQSTTNSQNMLLTCIAEFVVLSRQIHSYHVELIELTHQSIMARKESCKKTTLLEEFVHQMSTIDMSCTTSQTCQHNHQQLILFTQQNKTLVELMDADYVNLMLLAQQDKQQKNNNDDDPIQLTAYHTCGQQQQQQKQNEFNSITISSKQLFFMEHLLKTHNTLEMDTNPTEDTHTTSNTFRWSSAMNSKPCPVLNQLNGDSIQNFMAIALIGKDVDTQKSGVLKGVLICGRKSIEHQFTDDQVQLGHIVGMCLHNQLTKMEQINKVDDQMTQLVTQLETKQLEVDTLHVQMKHLTVDMRRHQLIKRLSMEIDCLQQENHQKDNSLCLTALAIKAVQIVQEYHHHHQSSVLVDILLLDPTRYSYKSMVLVVEEDLDQRSGHLAHNTFSTQDGLFGKMYRTGSIVRNVLTTQESTHDMFPFPVDLFQFYVQRQHQKKKMCPSLFHTYRCILAPVYDEQGQVYGAIVLFSPTFVQEEEKDENLEDENEEDILLNEVGFLIGNVLTQRVLLNEKFTYYQDKNKQLDDLKEETRQMKVKHELTLLNQQEKHTFDMFWRQQLIHWIQLTTSNTNEELNLEEICQHMKRFLLTTYSSSIDIQLHVHLLYPHVFSIEKMFQYVDTIQNLNEKMFLQKELTNVLSCSVDNNNNNNNNKMDTTTTNTTTSTTSITSNTSTNSQVFCGRLVRPQENENMIQNVLACVCVHHHMNNTSCSELLTDSNFQSKLSYCVDMVGIFLSKYLALQRMRHGLTEKSVQVDFLDQSICQLKEQLTNQYRVVNCIQLYQPWLKKMLVQKEKDIFQMVEKELCPLVQSHVPQVHSIQLYLIDDETKTILYKDALKDMCQQPFDISSKKKWTKKRQQQEHIITRQSVLEWIELTTRTKTRRNSFFLSCPLYMEQHEEEDNNKNKEGKVDKEKDSLCLMGFLEFELTSEEKEQLDSMDTSLLQEHVFFLKQHLPLYLQNVLTSQKNIDIYKNVQEKVHVLLKEQKSLQNQFDEMSLNYKENIFLTQMLEEWTNQMDNNLYFVSTDFNNEFTKLFEQLVNKWTFGLHRFHHQQQQQQQQEDHDTNRPMRLFVWEEKDDKDNDKDEYFECPQVSSTVSKHQIKKLFQLTDATSINKTCSRRSTKSSVNTLYFYWRTLRVKRRQINSTRPIIVRNSVQLQDNKDKKKEEDEDEEDEEDEEDKLKQQQLVQKLFPKYVLLDDEQEDTKEQVLSTQGLEEERLIVLLYAATTLDGKNQKVGGHLQQQKRTLCLCQVMMLPSLLNNHLQYSVEMMKLRVNKFVQTSEAMLNMCLLGSKILLTNQWTQAFQQEKAMELVTIQQQNVQLETCLNKYKYVLQQIMSTSFSKVVSTCQNISQVKEKLIDMLKEWCIQLLSTNTSTLEPKVQLYFYRENPYKDLLNDTTKEEEGILYTESTLKSFFTKGNQLKKMVSPCDERQYVQTFLQLTCSCQQQEQQKQSVLGVLIIEYYDSCCPPQQQLEDLFLMMMMMMNHHVNRLLSEWIHIQLVEKTQHQLTQDKEMLWKEKSCLEVDNLQLKSVLLDMETKIQKLRKWTPEFRKMTKIVQFFLDQLKKTKSTTTRQEITQLVCQTLLNMHGMLSVHWMDLPSKKNQLTLGENKEACTFFENPTTHMKFLLHQQASTFMSTSTTTENFEPQVIHLDNRTLVMFPLKLTGHQEQLTVEIHQQVQEEEEDALCCMLWNKQMDDTISQEENDEYFQLKLDLIGFLLNAVKQKVQQLIMRRQVDMYIDTHKANEQQIQKNLTLSQQELLSLQHKHDEFTNIFEGLTEEFNQQVVLMSSLSTSVLLLKLQEIIAQRIKRAYRMMDSGTVSLYGIQDKHGFFYTVGNTLNSYQVDNGGNLFELKYRTLLDPIVLQVLTDEKKRLDTVHLEEENVYNKKTKSSICIIPFNRKFINTTTDEEVDISRDYEQLWKCYMTKSFQVDTFVEGHKTLFPILSNGTTNSDVIGILQVVSTDVLTSNQMDMVHALTRAVSMYLHRYVNTVLLHQISLQEQKNLQQQRLLEIEEEQEEEKRQLELIQKKRIDQLHVLQTQRLTGSNVFGANSTSTTINSETKEQKDDNDDQSEHPLSSTATATGTTTGTSSPSVVEFVHSSRRRSTMHVKTALATVLQAPRLLTEEEEEQEQKMDMTNSRRLLPSPSFHPMVEQQQVVDTIVSTQQDDAARRRQSTTTTRKSILKPVGSVQLTSRRPTTIANTYSTMDKVMSITNTTTPSFAMMDGGGYARSSMVLLEMDTLRQQYESTLIELNQIQQEEHDELIQQCQEKISVYNNISNGLFDFCINVHKCKDVASVQQLVSKECKKIWTKNGDARKKYIDHVHLYLLPFNNKDGKATSGGHFDEEDNKIPLQAMEMMDKRRRYLLNALSKQQHQVREEMDIGTNQIGYVKIPGVSNSSGGHFSFKTVNSSSFWIGSDFVTPFFVTGNTIHQYTCMMGVLLFECTVPMDVLLNQDVFDQEDEARLTKLNKSIQQRVFELCQLKQLDVLHHIEMDTLEDKYQQELTQLHLQMSYKQRELDQMDKKWTFFDQWQKILQHVDMLNEQSIIELTIQQFKQIVPHCRQVQLVHPQQHQKEVDTFEEEEEQVVYHVDDDDQLGHHEDNNILLTENILKIRVYTTTTTSNSSRKHLTLTFHVHVDKMHYHPTDPTDHHHKTMTSQIKLVVTCCRQAMQKLIERRQLKKIKKQNQLTQQEKDLLLKEKQQLLIQTQELTLFKEQLEMQTKSDLMLKQENIHLTQKNDELTKQIQFLQEQVTKQQDLIVHLEKENVTKKVQFETFVHTKQEEKEKEWSVQHQQQKSSYQVDNFTLNLQMDNKNLLKKEKKMSKKMIQQHVHIQHLEEKINTKTKENQLLTEKVTKLQEKIHLLTQLQMQHKQLTSTQLTSQKKKYLQFQRLHQEQKQKQFQLAQELQKLTELEVNEMENSKCPPATSTLPIKMPVASSSPSSAGSSPSVHLATRMDEIRPLERTFSGVSSIASTTTWNSSSTK